jgi:hypothetical protein
MFLYLSQRCYKMLIDGRFADAQFGGYFAVFHFVAKAQFENRPLPWCEPSLDDGSELLYVLFLFFLRGSALFQGIKVRHPLGQRLTGYDVAASVTDALEKIGFLVTLGHSGTSAQKLSKHLADHIACLLILTQDGTRFSQQLSVMFTVQLFESLYFHLVVSRLSIRQTSSSFS